MDDMNVFVPITKIDAAQRLVYGVVTAEKPDISGEVCDYASTKPHYQKWSRNFASATEGKSLGNLRAMHSNVAAGKLVEIAFNDEQRRIEICGKVVDDAEWAKVEQGVYTGFSQGGRYLKRWPDPDEPALMRYTAEPMEVSLVDHPCLPEATFAVIKADGSTELRKFKDNPSHVSAALAEALAKIGARHSKADKERIKQTHDLLVGLDPDCCAAAGPVAGAKVETQPKFSPQAGEGAAEAADDDETAKLAKVFDRSLAKAIQAVTSHVDELAARVKKIEAQPLPLGTTSVRVAEKSEDFDLSQAGSAARSAGRAGSARRGRDPQGAKPADARHSGLSSAPRLTPLSPARHSGAERSEEPGIHNHCPWIWIPDSTLRVAPE